MKQNKKEIIKEKQLIKRVWKNHCNGQKLVTIPKDNEIDEGDLVKIHKVFSAKDVEEQNEKTNKRTKKKNSLGRI
jgi:hypothetical protein